MKKYLQLAFKFCVHNEKANKEISDESLKDYVQKINAEAKAKLHITAYTNSDIPQDQVKQILRNGMIS